MMLFYNAVPGVPVRTNYGKENLKLLENLKFSLLYMVWLRVRYESFPGI